MTVIHVERAWTGTEWLENARITLDGATIASVTANARPESGDERHAVVIPAVANLHSHAFQRAMAGLAERRGPGDDSFWSWRTVMYRFALTMTPEQIEAVAARLYMEMLESGFARVGEFHYLHHGIDGAPYADIAELAGRIAAASQTAGIALTLLPVFYAHSGFGGAAPIDGQRRFINDIDSFTRLMDRARTLLAPLDGAVLGLAPHSLRAVTPQELAAILPLAGDGPVHIHVAEQVKEVEDCLAWSGQRPVEWLLNHAPVDHRWCLIHATHMTEAETRAMAARGAVAGLCPITEANLGDGVFEAPAFLAAGGRFGIGSDSNVLVSLPEELRTLEYSQRLLRRARNVIAAPGAPTGDRLFSEALTGGAQALGTEAGIAPGMQADLVSLDLSHTPYTPTEALIDSFVFAGAPRIDCVWSRGRKQVEGGRHIRRDAISARFNAAMQTLVAGL